ncbi:MAG: CopD family protein [Anaerolineales bacterium]
MPIPPWALLLSFWLHMLITVLWLGTLAALALFVLPAMRRSLKPPAFAAWLAGVNRRLDPLGWFSLGLLTFTGLVQMDANPSYVGLFAVSNPWAAAIFAKHVVFLGMIAVSGYLTWVVSPALGRAALRRARGAGAKADLPILGRFQILISANLTLGLLVLAFTALARIS